MTTINTNAPRARSTFETRVYYEDTDAGGIVYHTAYLRWAERARTELLRELGATHADLAAKGCVTLLRDTRLTLLRPCRLDDRVTVHTELSDVRGARLLFSQEALLPCGAVLATIRAEAVTVTPGDFRPLRAEKYIHLP
ncbi:MAG: YbgC/FadM family acyl-CoA thioesterase [Rickettsiales bacterium]